MHSDTESDLEDEVPNLEDLFAAFPMKPIQALKGCFDVGVATVSPTASDENLLDTEQHNAMEPSLNTENEAELNDGQHLEKRKSLLQEELYRLIKFVEQISGNSVSSKYKFLTVYASNDIQT